MLSKATTSRTFVFTQRTLTAQALKAAEKNYAPERSRFQYLLQLACPHVLLLVNGELHMASFVTGASKSSKQNVRTLWLNTAAYAAATAALFKHNK